MFGGLFGRKRPPEPSFARFTDRSRRVLQLANEEAQRLRHEYVGSEHILLGLVAEGGGVGARVLDKLGVSADRVRTEIDRILKPGPAAPPAGRLPQTPPAKQAIERAIAAARELGHEYVGTEHLLLGLIRAEESVAAHVLKGFGLHAEQLRAEVVAFLEPPPK